MVLILFILNGLMKKMKIIEFDLICYFVLKSQQKSNYLIKRFHLKLIKLLKANWNKQTCNSIRQTL